MVYNLQLGSFSGPLEKLLELVEEKKLEVTGISLAQVTGDFLRYLEDLKKAEDFTRDKGSEVQGAEDLGPRILADFIVIASRLILIKSKSILPDLTLTEEEEGEIKDLEERLKIYREIRPAFKILSRLWRANQREFSRPYLLTKVSGSENLSGTRVFYPGENLNAEIFKESLARIFDTFAKLQLETKTIREKIVSVEEKIQEIIGRLKGVSEASFKNLSEKKSRSEIVAIFLAVLHLAREQMVLLEQEDYFSDIIIKSSVKN